MGEAAGSPVVALKSLGFRYDAIEDRIRCVAVPAGLATGQLGFWLTQRLAFQFMEQIHRSLGPEETESGKPEPVAFTRYGIAMVEAKEKTAAQVQMLPTDEKSSLGDGWLVTKLSMRTTGDRFHLYFIGVEEAAGLSLTLSELMRVVDMLETTFSAVGWKLPQGSYRNLGAYLAESEGQRVN